MSHLRDFDFLLGNWSVRHRRLRRRGVGCRQWDEFEGSAATRPLLGGLCNIEEHDIPGTSFSGVALRSFDRSASLWSIYWVSAGDGVLQPPVAGTFTGEVGRFEGQDVDGERPILVRFIWDRSSSDAPRWAQSFSYDRAASWELNWEMEFRRAG